MNNHSKLNILYTDIGRGHPFYLDGIISELRRSAPSRIILNIQNVFGISSGLSLRIWQSANILYRIGSQGGLAGFFYKAFRQRRKASSRGFGEYFMGRHIRRYIEKHPYPTLVAHPILVPLISDLVPAYYQHGEIAVPREALVDGCKAIFVPLEESYKGMKKSIDERTRVLTSGLCIERDLMEKAEQYFADRIRRIKGEAELTGGFFSSGAEPRAHVEKIIYGLRSLADSHHRALVFCKAGGRLEERLRRMDTRIFSADKFPEDIRGAIDRCRIVALQYDSREEEEALTARIFGHFDFFVAPSHERTNWAVGLGIPMFILHPIIGTFSPLNRKFLLEKGVAFELTEDREANELGHMVSKLQHNGSLEAAARRGYGSYKLNGFETIAQFLIEELAICD